MKTVKLCMLALLLAVSSVVSAQSARSIIKAYERMLNEYCIEYYSDDFVGRLYKEGSIAITCDPEDAIDPLTGEIVLSGTHSYDGKSLKTHTGVRWEAYITELGNGKYRIKFDKYYEPDKIGPFTIQQGYMEKGRERVFTYPKKKR